MRISLAAAVNVAAALIFVFSSADALGSAATLAISSNTVCGVLSGASPNSIRCSRVSVGLEASASFPLFPNVSFSSVSGGRSFLCGLRAGGRSFFCWPSTGNNSDTPPVKRVYNGSSVTSLTVGGDQIAALGGNGTGVFFWRGDSSFHPNNTGTFRSLTSGGGFSCAIDSNDAVQCWGNNLGSKIKAGFLDISMSSIVAGDSHVCGFTVPGNLICKGGNFSGQLNAPPTGAPFEFTSLALGINHSCAIRQNTSTVVCWGGGASVGGAYRSIGNTTFEFIVAGGNLTCGVVSANLSVICWAFNESSTNLALVPLPSILPGICVSDESSCRCGTNTDSQTLCSGTGFICKFCPTSQNPSPSPSPPPQPPPPPPSSRKKSKWNYVFLVIGAVGGFAGVCSIAYWIFTCVCRRKKVHNSVQPTITTAVPVPAVPSPYTSPSGSRSSIFIRQASRVIRRQRSGPSSVRDRPEPFTLAELAAATKNFSLENKIGSGSFGTVYKGKLSDGREVAIKRSESGPRTKKFQEKETAFQSEIAFLSRLNHKHLVGLVGYCEEKEERLLVYEYMKNGALHDHLHKSEIQSEMLNSWRMRIKVLRDASRGIEYLHSYAVPPIIHRDIKSSNILLDGNWVARVSDFGLSLMGPETEGEHLSMKAAGTVGYMDPEYYGLHHLTVKSDVYGFGVVMLEVLTGKRAIFKDAEGGGSPTSVVDYALPNIAAGEVGRVLDGRVAAPSAQEAEAVELVAYTAVHCVSLEGRERPAMSDISANLESALAMCEGSHVSISSASARSCSD